MSRNEIDVTIVFGDALPGTQLHVIHIDIITHNTGGSDLLRSPEMLLGAINQEPRALRWMREVIGTAWNNCTLGCTKFEACRHNLEPYTAVVAAHLIKHRKVIVDHYTHQTVNADDLTDLLRHLAQLEGMLGPSAAAQRDTLTSALTELYRLPLVQVHDLESIVVDGMAARAIAVRERVELWRRFIEAIRTDIELNKPPA